jgi:hypothetical protein
MPSSLPTEDTLSEIMSDFGIGTYDAPTQQGESGESLVSKPRRSVPDGGIEMSISDPDQFSSYASSALPGDTDAPARGRNPKDKVIDKVIPSTSQSELPCDKDNPSARSDYFDHTVIGSGTIDRPAISDVWADEDSGAYAQTSLPGVNKNEVDYDNQTGGIGNAWSGYVVDDTSSSCGTPSDEFLENESYPRSDKDGYGRFLASSGDNMTKVSTNFVLIDGITTDFIKKFGKKDVTRRHVMQYLSSVNQSQHLVSDVVRCLRVCHKVDILDLLDVFPFAKKASSAGDLGSIVEDLSDLAVLYRDNTDVSREIMASLGEVAMVSGLVAKAFRG